MRQSLSVFLLVFMSLIFGYAVVLDHAKSRIYINNYCFETRVVVGSSEHSLFNEILEQTYLTHRNSVKIKKNLRKDFGIYLTVSLPEFGISKEVNIPDYKSDYIFITINDGFDMNTYEIAINGYSRQFVKSRVWPGL